MPTPPMIRPLPLRPLAKPPGPPPPLWTLEGGSGGDTLNGTANNDRIYGAGGNDTINALAGNDLINGGAGANRLSGGAGADLFLFDKATVTAGQLNVVTDFKVSEHDHLALLGFGRLPLVATQPTATSNGGIYQHVVKVAGADVLQLDVYLVHSATAAATIQLLGVTTIQTAADLFGGPPLHHR